MYKIIFGFNFNGNDSFFFELIIFFGNNFWMFSFGEKLLLNKYNIKFVLM